MRGEDRTGGRTAPCSPGGTQRSPGDTPGPPMARNPPVPHPPPLPPSLRLGGKPPGPIARRARSAASALTVLAWGGAPPGTPRWLKAPFLRHGALAVLIMTVLAWFPAPGQALAAHTTAHAARPTVVSLTFDDGTADQLAAARVLHSYGMAGTFFIITGAVGAPRYMSLAGLRQLAAAGDEIGGHTVSHLDLVNTTPAEARRQICAGRDILTRWGLCRRRHNVHYADLPIMPTRVVELLVAAA